MSIIIKSGTSGNTATVTSDGELAVTADNQVHNGTTWEKTKTADAADGTTGVGVPAAGTMGFDGTNWHRLKAGTAGDLAVSITNPGAVLTGTFAGITPWGQLSVACDGVPAFTDVFEGGTIDTVNKWTLTGTVAPTNTLSNLLVNPGTTGNATSVATTIPTFLLATSVVFGVSVILESGVVTGNHRFWGFGIPPSVPGTAAAPLQDGLGFELDTAGTLRASVYNAGTRVFTQSITTTATSDGQAHLYVIQARGDVAFFYIDTFDVPAAVAAISPSVKQLPMRFASLNTATVSAAPQFTVVGMSVIDNARSATGLSDGTYPWRKARIDAAGALNVAARPTDLVVSVTAGSGVALTATLPAAGAGLYHYITRICVTKYCTLAVLGSATPTVVTTTNLGGSLAYTLGTAMAIGTTIDRIDDFTAAPLKSTTANTATTIVAPLVASVLWRITVQYYVGT